MPLYRCVRCNWQGSDSEANQHAQESGHQLCIICAKSLQIKERQTCQPCVGRVRADLADIESLYALLPDELGNLGSSAIADVPTGQGDGEAALPGGDVLALLSPGSAGRSQVLGVRVPGGRRDASHELDEHDDDPQSVAFELSRHEDDWRLTRGEPAATCEATVTQSKGYLNARLTWAGDHHPAFDEFAKDIQKLRTRLQRATAHDETPVRGVTCFECEATLLRHWTDGGLDDEWACPRCRRRYTPAEHSLAVRSRMEERRTDPAALLTTAEIRGKTQLSESQLRVWQQRGKLQSQGKDALGRNLYRWGDVKVLIEARRVAS